MSSPFDALLQTVLAPRIAQALRVRREQRLPFSGDPEMSGSPHPLRDALLTYQLPPDMPPKPPVDPEFVEDSRQHAIELMLHEGTINPARAFLLTSTGVGGLLLLPMPEPNVDRRDLFAEIGMRTAFTNAERTERFLGDIVHAAFISEIWTVTRTRGDPPVEGSIAEDPRRIELVYVECYEEATQACEGYFYEPLRDAGGKLLDLVVWHGPVDGTQAVGGDGNPSTNGPILVASSLLMDLCDGYTLARLTLPLWKELTHGLF